MLAIPASLQKKQAGLLTTKPVQDHQESLSSLKAGFVRLPTIEDDPIISVVQKLVSRLGMWNQTCAPREYLPAHSYVQNLLDWRAVMMRESGIDVFTDSSSWNVLEAFRGDKFEEKTKAFWALMQYVGEWGSIQEHLVPLFALSAKKKNRETCGACIDLMCLFLAPILDEAIDKPAQVGRPTVGVGISTTPVNVSELLHWQRVYKKVLIDSLPGLHRILVFAYQTNDRGLMFQTLQFVLLLLMVPDETNTTSNYSSSVPQSQATSAVYYGHGKSYGSSMLVVKSLYQAGIVDFLFTTISSLPDKTQGRLFWSMHGTLIHIMCYLFPLLVGDMDRGQPFSKLIKPKSYDELDEFSGHNSSAYHMSSSPSNSIVDHASTRHAKFGGTISVKLSTGQEYHLGSMSRVLESSKRALVFDANTRAQARRRLYECPVYLHPCKVNSLSDLKLIKRLSQEFLDSCLNSLMSFVSEHLILGELPERWHRNLLRLMSYFVSFVMHSNEMQNEDNQTSLATTQVIERLQALFGVLNVEMILHYARYMQHLHVVKAWTGLAECVSWFKQLLTLLHHMKHFDRKKDSSDEEEEETKGQDIGTSLTSPMIIRHAAKSVLSNLFYHHWHGLIEVRNLLRDIKNPNPRTIAELVDTNHVLLQLIHEEGSIEAISKRLGRRKGKKRARRENDKQDIEEEGFSLFDAGDLDDQSAEIEGSNVELTSSLVDFEVVMIDYLHPAIVDCYLKLLSSIAMDSELGGSYLPTKRPLGWLTLQQQSRVAWFLSQIHDRDPNLLMRISALDVLYEKVVWPALGKGLREPDEKFNHPARNGVGVISAKLTELACRVTRDFVSALKKDRCMIVMCLTQRTIQQMNRAKSLNSVEETSIFPIKGANDEVSDEDADEVEFDLDQVDYLVSSLLTDWDINGEIRADDERKIESSADPASILRSWVLDLLYETATRVFPRELNENDKSNNEDESFKARLFPEAELVYLEPCLPVHQQLLTDKYLRKRFKALLRALGFQPRHSIGQLVTDWTLQPPQSAEERDQLLKKAAILDQAIQSYFQQDMTKVNEDEISSSYIENTHDNEADSHLIDVKIKKKLFSCSKDAYNHDSDEINTH